MPRYRVIDQKNRIYILTADNKEQIRNAMPNLKSVVKLGETSKYDYIPLLAIGLFCFWFAFFVDFMRG